MILVMAFLQTSLFADKVDPLYKAKSIQAISLDTRIYAQDFDPSSFSIPLSMGYIDDIYKGTSGKVVFHIKDAHCNYDAQKMTSNLIGKIVEKYDVSLVNLEGGSGEYDLSIFDNIKDRRIKEKLADKYLRDGTVNGAEFYRINNPEKVELYGLEDSVLYDQNLAIYKNVLENTDRIFAFLGRARKALNEKKEMLFNEELKGYGQKRFLFQTNNIQIFEYISYLEKISGEYALQMDAWPNIKRTIALILSERTIDFDAAERERDALILELSEKMSWYDRSALVSVTKNFTNKKIPEHAFYKFLFKKALELKLDREQYAYLVKYSTYLDIYREIKGDILLKEIKGLEASIEGLLCETDREKKLLAYSNQIETLARLFKLEVGSKEILSLKGLLSFNGFLELVQETVDSDVEKETVFAHSPLTLH